jgi:hypothetical protein
VLSRRLRQNATPEARRLAAAHAPSDEHRERRAECAGAHGRLAGKPLATRSPMGTRVSPDSYAWGASARERAVFTVERILDFGFSVLYGLLTIRFLLAFFQASAGAAFYGFVHSLSQPFFAPFQGLFGTTLVAGHPVVCAACSGCCCPPRGDRGTRPDDAGSP